MATSSGTYNFSPSNGELILFAFGMCGIRRTEITQQHLTDARLALNLLFSAWANDTPNLWTIDLVTQTLTAGTATYPVDAKTIMILDAYITTGSGTSINDRIIWPISRSEYAAFPNKTIQAPPTVYWFDRLLSPTITLWQVPPSDGNTYTLNYYRCLAIQDANVAGGEIPNIQPRWLMAITYNLAEMLHQAYPIEGVDGDKLSAKAAQYLEEARAQDTENVPLYLAPMTNGYFPR